MPLVEARKLNDRLGNNNGSPRFEVSDNLGRFDSREVVDSRWVGACEGLDLIPLRFPRQSTRRSWVGRSTGSSARIEAN